MVKNTQPYALRTMIVALLLSAVLTPQPGRACAPVPRPGQYVRIAEESAIIVWDEKTRTQRFIRRATFDTDAPDFGFLVPTPTEPELAEVSDSVFDELENFIRPKEIKQTEITGVDFTPLLFSYFLLSRAGSDSAPVASAVRVLSTQRVAGYDAVVLEADNAAGLNGWLSKHGYASRPALTEWLAPYVAAHWKITAFKIAKNAGYREVGTSAVRMSFKTDRPFFPYREPADQREAKETRAGDRLLRVFLISSSRMDGTLGDNASTPWPGQTVWSDRIPGVDRVSFNSLVPRDLYTRDRQLPSNTWLSVFRDRQLPSNTWLSVFRNRQLPSNTWLSVFEDKSSPRPGTDEVYFAPSKQQGTVQLPPQIRTVGRSIPVPLDLILILIGGLILLMRWKRRSEERR